MTKHDTKIILITCIEFSAIHNKDIIVTSHGICNNSMDPVILPCEHPAALGAVMDVDLEEWVINIDPMDHWGRIAK